MDIGVEIIVKNNQKLKNLKSLNLSKCNLSEKSVKLLSNEINFAGLV